jgi:hypothetical protein
MKTVYFVRHGSTEGNEKGAYQHLYTPLSDLGRRQAEFVAHRFERIHVDIVIASDMERAAETGRCIAERNKFSIVFDPLFQERLLLDSRVVVLPIAYHPNFVILSSLNPLFFNSLKNELCFSDNAGV